MAWTQTANIRGASGTPGASGAQGASGATGASGASYVRNVSTITVPTALSAAANTDYVYFLSTGASGGDSSYSSVTALLTGDGSDASTTITDSSSITSNWTANGNAKLSTATKKYGTAAISFDGTNSSITPTAASSNFAFGTSAFTVEMWAYFNSTSHSIFYDSRTGGSGTEIVLKVENGKIYYELGGSYVISGTATISTSTWYHIALSRSGTSTRLFVNGTQDGSTFSDSTNYTCATGRPIIGRNGTTGSLWVNGFMDEVRITKGVARYTANFTAPTAAFPTSAGTLGTPTMPTASSNSSRYSFRNVSGSVILLGASGSQLINGAASYTLGATGAVELISDGSSGWYSI